MAEYWLVSAPGEATPEDTWALINEKTASLATNHKLNIPDLKVGVAGRRMQRRNRLPRLQLQSVN